MPRSESIEKNSDLRVMNNWLFKRNVEYKRRSEEEKNHLNSSAKIPHLLQITLSWLEANQKQST